MNDIAHSFLRLDRLRVMARGQPVYDQKFHAGVNIIRGDNGSGKSTIADFVHFILGGDFKDWKKAAEICDEVQAEISTPRGKLSLKREKVLGRPPVWVFFGSLEEAGKHGIEGWERYPIQRVQSNASFTEVLFRSMLLPEAQSDGASNITSHQLLRLLYSDQRTPAPRLFRFEPFDKPTIRVAVGDLVCGIKNYDLFEVELEVRDLTSKFDKVDAEWGSLLKSFPDQTAVSVEKIQSSIQELMTNVSSIEVEIANVDDIVSSDQSKAFDKARHLAAEKLKKLRASLSKTSRVIEETSLEIVEIGRFLEHLEQSLVALAGAEDTAGYLGSIEFSHCPSCLKELKPALAENTCTLCGQPDGDHLLASRYNQIRLDIELQIKESKQLLADENAKHLAAKKHYAKERKNYELSLSEFTASYELSNSPRDAYLADRHSRLGRIHREIYQFETSLQRASELDALTIEKSKLNGLLTAAKDKRTALSRTAQQRRRAALNQISKHAVGILHADVSGAQEEFKNAESVDVSFEDDAVSVDGQMNFAESSNVFLKNAAILSLHLAACQDASFFHPRFALFDNIEDKGMQPKRSHKFQELIVRLSTEMPITNQIIFTTSLMNPNLELEDYVIGPYYDEHNKTLEL